MAKSLIPQRVKNTGIDLALAAGFIAGGIYLTAFLNRRFGIINKFISGAGSIGTGLGQAVGLGLANIPIGIGEGGAKSFADARAAFDKWFKETFPENPSSAPPDSSGQTVPGNNPVPSNLFPSAGAETVSGKNITIVRGNISLISRSGKVSSIPQMQQAARQIQVYSGLRTVQTVTGGKTVVITPKPGQKTAVFTTTTGGTRVAVGSPALIARLKQNLRK